MSPVYLWQGTGAQEAILSKLSLSQLRLLQTRLPAVTSRAAYVDALLAALHPGPLVSLTSNTAAHNAYLDAVETVARGLPSSYNKLRLYVAHHRVRGCLLTHAHTHALLLCSCMLSFLNRRSAASCCSQCALCCVH